MVKGPTFRVDSPGSTLGLAVYFFVAQFFSRFVFVFLNHIFPVWLVSLYSYCWPIIASRGFCEKRISIAYVAAGPRKDIIYFKNHRFRVTGTEARNVNSYLERGCQKKMCTRQSRKVEWDIFLFFLFFFLVEWDMINTVFPNTVAFKPTFVAFL